VDSREDRVHGEDKREGGMHGGGERVGRLFFVSTLSLHKFSALCILS
jgi:hypothetical protein